MQRRALSELNLTRTGSTKLIIAGCQNNAVKQISKIGDLTDAEAECRAAENSATANDYVTEEPTVETPTEAESLNTSSNLCKRC